VTENVRLVEPLNEGGMGSVWLAEHLGLRAPVAVKFLASDEEEDQEEAVARFRREASAAAQIKSPHVVQTLDHGVMEDGIPYIVMELLEGESLAERLARVGQLPLGQVAEIVRQAARGLAKAHAAGIVHRDVKPDNVFLVDSEDDELFVKLLDFGVAKQTVPQSYSVVTATGTILGTPAYMSPEQLLNGKAIDHRTDLWSLGVVAYHALVGELPFSGDTVGALCIAIHRGVFRPPSRARDGLPAPLDDWMARALATDRGARFASAKEMARALVDALTPEVAATRDKRSRPRWLSTGALALFGFSAGVGLVFATWQDDHLAASPPERSEEAAPSIEVPEGSPTARAAEPEAAVAADPPSEASAPSPSSAPATSPRPAAKPERSPVPPAPSARPLSTKDRGF
jgi:serine/threonine-protein kinase